MSVENCVNTVDWLHSIFKKVVSLYLKLVKVAVSKLYQHNIPGSLVRHLWTIQTKNLSPFSVRFTTTCENKEQTWSYHVLLLRLTLPATKALRPESFCGFNWASLSSPPPSHQDEFSHFHSNTGLSLPHPPKETKQTKTLESKVHSSQCFRNVKFKLIHRLPVPLSLALYLDERFIFNLLILPLLCETVEISRGEVRVWARAAGKQKSTVTPSLTAATKSLPQGPSFVAGLSFVKSAQRCQSLHCGRREAGRCL